jgi:hypothetical protein
MESMKQGDEKSDETLASLQNALALLEQNSNQLMA